MPREICALGRQGPLAGERHSAGRNELITAVYNNTPESSVQTAGAFCLRHLPVRDRLARPAGRASAACRCSPWHQPAAPLPEPPARLRGARRSPGAEPLPPHLPGRAAAAPERRQPAGLPRAQPRPCRSAEPRPRGSGHKRAEREACGETQGGRDGKISGLERDRITTGAARLHQPAMADFRDLIRQLQLVRVQVFP
ncbi:proline-rich protein 18-like [Passer montanus]|uniref:proline-rich protein 18-like n=1 Tax=Passer montanus TaxID=9160 RepID=UPI0019600D09|nr:proline-rich protein 18-like [Passer montanus]